LRALRFIGRRLLFLMPTIFAVLLFTFLLVRIGGQDPVGLLAGPTSSVREIEEIRRQLHLDQPIWTQFSEFVVRIAEGDLGRSWLSSRPVAVELIDRLPATLEMVLLGGLLGAVIGVSTGLRAAFRPDSVFDHASRILSLLGFGVPTYFLGLVAVLVFFYFLGWAPPPMGRIDLMIATPPRVTGSVLVDALIAGDRDAAWSAAGRLVLPVLCVTIVFAAPIIKQSRAIALDILGSEYVRYARASGLGERLVRRIVWRNARVPLLTYGATEMVGLFGTASVLELIFSWGGMSQFGLDAILHGDFAVVQGYVLFVTALAMLLFLTVDLLVLWLEPRAGLR
jgi:ABC-type dipeptide/oligopeptide/nickel transport system permease component